MTAPVTWVGVLGPLEIVVGGTLVRLGGGRLRALVCRLAVDAGRVVPTGSLVDAVWPDGGVTDSKHALHSLMTRLRGALPNPSVLRSEGTGYCWSAPTEAVDVRHFECLAHDGRRALARGEPALAVRLLSEGLGLWRGEALADAGAAPYVTAAVVRLAELRVTAIEDRVTAQLVIGLVPDETVAELEELISQYPLRERLWMLLVRTLHAGGRSAEALSRYAEVRRSLVEELGAEPGPELAAAHLAVLRGRPPIRRRGNLRAGMTSLIGRSREVAQIRNELAAGRLVTLVGPGGSGKTRLATGVAAELADEVPGGAWLVELAQVTDPADLPSAVIGALGLHDSPLPDLAAVPRDVVDRLVEAFSATETLLVLDNCEHLVEWVAGCVAELLGRCPGLRVLATAREPLGVLGEMLIDVPPLALPAAGASPAEAMTAPSVRLFVDRSRSGRRDFAVTEDNVRAVVEVCRRLDGLPLAIELAAARMRSLSPAQLVARLDDRFRVLTGGSRAALPRHRTLRAAVDASWESLSNEERRCARWSATLSGGFTLDAVEAICGSAGVELLGALVDKSFVRPVHGSEQRYRMLETIREYCLARLAEAGETATARVALTQHLLRLLDSAGPHLRGGGQVPWLRRLTAEHTNLLDALRFARDAGEQDTAVRLAAHMGQLWTIRGEHAEAAAHLRFVLDLPAQAASPAHSAATVWYLLNTVLSGGISRSELSPAEISARLPEPDPDDSVGVLLEPALTLAVDDLVAGQDVVDRLLRTTDGWPRAMLYLLRALLEANHDAAGQMRADLSTAAELFRGCGERWGLALSLSFLAYTELTNGGFDCAIDALHESIRLQREIASGDGAVLERVWLAQAYHRKGAVAQARAQFDELAESGSATRYRSYIGISLGDLARQAGDLDAAERHYRAAGRTDDGPVHRAMLGCALGHLALDRDAPATALRHLAASLSAASETLDMPLVATVAVAVARLRERGTTAQDAAEVLGAAESLRGTADRFHPDVVPLTDRLQTTLGERTYLAAYDRGRALDRPAALALLDESLLITCRATSPTPTRRP
ncbi:BTAD domain-containing putative transcriptional regulator [Nocardia sp. NPDC058499]|uniref:BTAD domain-containing putative transcriptional regulator n=1 Tax=Nocardia sp. NPDC058499 TaxID=3346530 RepID=UPI00365D9A4F